MKHILMVTVVCLSLAGGWLTKGLAKDAEVLASVSDQDRCHVCGMFVGKYPEWITQAKLSDGRVVMFDGPKDMLVYFFNPEEYGAAGAQVTDIVVKDYYTQEWIDGRKALYVTGSDVYGPMGKEFIPMSSRAAAENFLKDHHGQKIIAFDEITSEIVQGMRKGHKMKMKK